MAGRGGGPARDNVCAGFFRAVICRYRRFVPGRHVYETHRLARGCLRGKGPGRFLRNLWVQHRQCMVEAEYCSEEKSWTLRPVWRVSISTPPEFKFARFIRSARKTTSVDRPTRLYSGLQQDEGSEVIPGKTYSLDELWQIVLRRKWLMVLPALLIGAASAGYVRSLPNKYRSETLVLVVPQRVPESYVKATVTARIEDRLQSISQQIMSRTRLEQIVTDFNLYAKERADKELMEDIVEKMRTRDIGIDIIKGDAFRVSYKASDPRTAMRVTERLASLFIDESLRDREVLAEGTSQFLATQLDEARRQLVLTETKIE